MINKPLSLLSILILGTCDHSLRANELTLDPPPIVEGVSGARITLNVKEIDLGPEGKAFKEYLSRGYEDTQMYLLELSSETPYWLDYSSSMGANSRKDLMKWVKKTLLSKYNEKEKLGEIVKEDSLLSSFFNGATKINLKQGVNVLSDFIGKLLSPNDDHAAIDRSFYALSSKICPFSQRFFSFIIVDPEPFRGPDKKTYLIVIESVYEE